MLSGVKREWISDDGMLHLIQGDSAEVLSDFENEKFDCCVTDPPYGIGADVGQRNRADKQHGKAMAPSKNYGDLQWDSKPISSGLVNECRRVSRWQVLFGGNYFELPPARCWLVWDKMNGENDYADCELAWTNLNKAVRKISFLWHGMLRGEPGERIHPTQKPIRVMQWAIAHCHQHTTVIDPFAGSFTTAVACHRMGIKCVCIEREPSYFDAGVKRVQDEIARTAMFDTVPTITQRSMFDATPSRESDQ